MAERKESESDLICAAPRLSLSDPVEPEPTNQIPYKGDEKPSARKCAKKAVKENSVNQSDEAESNLQVALRFGAQGWTIFRDDVLPVLLSVAGAVGALLLEFSFWAYGEVRNWMSNTNQQVTKKAKKVQESKKGLNSEGGHGKRKLTELEGEEAGDQANNNEGDVEPKKWRPDGAYLAIHQFIRRMFTAGDQVEVEVEAAEDTEILQDKLTDEGRHKIQEFKRALWKGKPDLDFGALATDMKFTGSNLKGVEVKSLEALAKSTVDNLNINNLISKCEDQTVASKAKFCTIDVKSTQDVTSKVIKSEEEPNITESNAETIDSKLDASESKDDTTKCSVETNPEESVTEEMEDVKSYEENVNNVEVTGRLKNEVTEPNNANTNSKPVDDLVSAVCDLRSLIQDIQSNCEVTDLLDDVVKSTVEYAEAQTETGAFKSTIESSESTDKCIKSSIEDAECAHEAKGSSEDVVHSKEVTRSEDSEVVPSPNEEDAQSSMEAIELIGEVTESKLLIAESEEDSSEAKKDFINSSETISENDNSSAEDVSEQLDASVDKDSSAAHTDKKVVDVIEKNNMDISPMNILKEKDINSHEHSIENTKVMEKSVHEDHHIQEAERTHDKENTGPDVRMGKNHDGIIDILPEDMSGEEDEAQSPGLIETVPAVSDIIARFNVE